MDNTITEKYVKRLRNKKIIQRKINYLGGIFIEHFQINKSENFICWERYILPTNRDKSKAIKWNSCLSLKDVINILRNGNTY